MCIKYYFTKEIALALPFSKQNIHIDNFKMDGSIKRTDKSIDTENKTKKTF